ncbi:carbohydrate kinase family protein [Calditrichota bacterium LG25]
MRIAVLGTFLKDRIIDQDGRVTESKGGLFYTIDALRAICAEDDVVSPISYVGRDFKEEVFAHFKDDARIDLSGLVLYDGFNNCVELRYVTTERREERSLYPMPSLTVEQLKPFLDYDLFVANFISGWEAQLTEFRKFASRFEGLVAIDVHSLTLERSKEGFRRLRKIENIEAWIEFAKIVQCNETEFQQITELNPESFYKLFCFNHKKIVNLTFGKRGSLHVYRNGENVEQIWVRAEQRINVIDPTGCGDVFLAGFVYFYSAGDSVRSAAEKANTLAAVAGSKKGLLEWQELRDGFNHLVG